MKKKTDLVTKSNRLIEASYRLTLTEQQIILYCIAKTSSVEKQGFLMPMDRKASASRSNSLGLYCCWTMHVSSMKAPPSNHWNTSPTEIPWC